MSDPNRKTIVKEVETQELDIPEEELEEYKEAFALFDKDGSGDITLKEFLKVLKNLGQNLSKDEADKLLKELDTDGSGSIGFDEFVSYMKKTRIEEEVEDEDIVIKAFMTFDKDQSGSISNQEFRHILCNLGDKFTQEECDEIFKEADLDNDGVLNYREFVDFWRGK